MFLLNNVSNQLFKYRSILLLLVLFLSRLPQLSSELLLIDGDEGIVGMMALNFMKGTGYPYFFASQSYGFTYVEVLFTSAFYSLFDFTAISLKLGILSLWAIGVLFFFKTLELKRGNLNKWIPFLFIVCFILFPSWMVWSMKARGGYVTAFTFFSAGVYFLLKIKSDKLIFFVNAFIFIALYQAQPLWLAGFIPISLYVFLNNKRSLFLKSKYFILGFSLSSFIFFLMKIKVAHFTKPPIFNLSNISFENIKLVPKLIFDNLNGNYYYRSSLETLFFSGSILVVIFLVFIMYYAINTIKNIKAMELKHALLLAFIGTVSYVFILKADSPRYLLPLSQLGFLFIYFNINNSILLKIKEKVIISLFIVLGITSSLEFKNYKFENRVEDNFNHLIVALKKQKISHVYFKHGLLQWQVMFYSSREIKGRSFSKFDRFPELITEIDSTLINAKKNVAIVDYYNPNNLSQKEEITIVDNVFVIRTKVDKRILIDEGFNFSSNL